MTFDPLSGYDVVLQSVQCDRSDKLLGNWTGYFLFLMIPLQTVKRIDFAKKSDTETSKSEVPKTPRFSSEPVVRSLNCSEKFKNSWQRCRRFFLPRLAWEANWRWFEIRRNLTHLCAWTWPTSPNCLGKIVELVQGRGWRVVVSFCSCYSFALWPQYNS